MVAAIRKESSAIVAAQDNVMRYASQYLTSGPRHTVLSVSVCVRFPNDSSLRSSGENVRGFAGLGG
jgi:hypothetical protein